MQKRGACNMIKGYIGSYATSQSEAILQFEFDEEQGVFLQSKPYIPYKDSKYMSLYKGDFASVLKQERAGIAFLGKDARDVDIVYSEDITSCYITQDDAFIYTANYHEGTVSIYTKKGSVQLYKRILIAPHAGCHQVIVHDSYILVPCLLHDVIKIYDRRHDFAFVSEIKFIRGSGPRHGIFDTKGHFFLVSELSNQLFAFDYDVQGTMKLNKVTSLFDQTGTKAASAAIRLSDDERFLYISIRDANQIVVYDCLQQSILQRVYAGGDHPRDIVLSNDMKFLFVANRFTDHVCVFKRNKKTGMLTPMEATLHAIQCVCIVLEK